MKRLVIGTRGSDLALWQARHVREALLGRDPGLEIDLQVIRTKGDKILDTALSKIGDKGLFTKEIENALLDKTVDLAVHSLKDLPTSSPAGLTVAAILNREDPADVLVSKDGLSLAELSRGAKVLTGSLRRRAQILHLRGDLLVEPVRGNVPTRLKKFEASDAAAIIFAGAGLDRLKLAQRITQRLEPAEFLPACGQGALAVQIREGDSGLAELVRPLDHLESRAATTAERTLLAELGGGCQVPIGAYACMGREPPIMTVIGMVADLDGERLFKRSVSGQFASVDSAIELGQRLAAELQSEQVCREILEQLRDPPVTSPESNK